MEHDRLQCSLYLIRGNHRSKLEEHRLIEVLRMLGVQQPPLNGRERYYSLHSVLLSARHITHSRYTSQLRNRLVLEQVSGAELHTALPSFSNHSNREDRVPTKLEEVILGPH